MLTQTSELAVAQTYKPRAPRTLSPAALAVVLNFEKLAGSVLLDDVQVGAICGVKAVTVRNWRYRGEGPRFVLIHGRPKVSVAVLREWLAGLPAVEK